MQVALSVCLCAGSVLCLRNGTELEVIRAPAILGEVAILAREFELCRSRPMTFRALTHCRLWELNLQNLDHVSPSSICTSTPCARLHGPLLSTQLKLLEIEKSVYIRTT